MLPGLNTVDPPVKSEEKTKKDEPALYGHGVCKWPGCDTPCDNLEAFKKYVKHFIAINYKYICNKSFNAGVHKLVNLLIL